MRQHEHLHDEKNFPLSEVATLMTEFAYHADHGNAQGVAELFMPNGEFCIGGSVLSGRPEIAAFCHERFNVAGRMTRHVWSNLRLQTAMGDVWETCALQMTYERADDCSEPQVRVSDLLDTICIASDGSLLFRRRVIARAMTISGACLASATDGHNLKNTK